MAQTRRRKKTSGDKPRLEKFPLTGTFCGGDGSIPCGEPQYESPSGPVCKFGHGGAEMLDKRPTGDWVSGDGSSQDDENTAHRHDSEPPVHGASDWEKGRGRNIPFHQHDSPRMTRGLTEEEATTQLNDEIAKNTDAAVSLDNIDETAKAMRDYKERPAAPFEVREGDRLSVTYAGAKLQIVQFNTVELDGAFYSRTLVPGDDPAAEWDRIYAFLKDKALAGAREKLATFADELRRARERAKPGHPDGK